MAGFEALRSELAEKGISVAAASVDPEDKALEVAGELSFPVAHGVNHRDADAIGAWWDERRNFIQPSEFILRRDGTVVSATYSTGPIGRLDAKDALSLIGFLEARRGG